MTISVQDVVASLAREKRPAGLIGWVKALSRDDPQWLQFAVALRYTDTPDEYPEGLMLRGVWRPRFGSFPASWGFGFFYRSQRVFAIDCMPLAKHANRRAGRGPPYFGQIISGIHEHSWSDEGYGYAEPIDGCTLSDVGTTWALFARRAGVYPDCFVHPDSSVEAGQGALDL